MSASPESRSPLAGDILVCAPHMDDETLACGMLIALHAMQGQVHVLFASDGARSPEAPSDSPAAASGLSSVREAEAREALGALGVPGTRLYFLGLPDGELRRNRVELEDRIVEHADRARVAHVLVPFRYDRHPDHIALNRAAIRAHRGGRLSAEVVEYFVYARSRLLASGDVRNYLRAEETFRVRTEEAALRKRDALARYRSQTTLYFEGQRRPILTDVLIQDVCGEAEVFLRYRPGQEGSAGLARGRCWVPLACRLEPPIKRLKDRLTGGGVR